MPRPKKSPSQPQVNFSSAPLDTAQTRRVRKMLAQYSAGRRGLIDGGKAAGVVVTYAEGQNPALQGKLRRKKGGEVVFPRARLPRGADISGIDTPSPDLVRMKMKSGEILRGGADRPADRKTLRAVKAILERNFSKEELRGMNLYIEPSVALKGCAAAHAIIRTAGKDFSVIFVRPNLDRTLLEYAVTHEAVHARRAAQGQHTKDRNREESRAEFETLGRLSGRGVRAIETVIATHGNYRHLGRTSAECVAALRHDRNLITAGGTARWNRGVSLVRRAETLYPRAAISGLRIRGGG